MSHPRETDMERTVATDGGGGGTGTGLTQCLGWGMGLRGGGGRSTKIFEGTSMAASGP